MGDGKQVLVMGAGGRFARHVAPQLIARGTTVRGLVRNQAGEAVARASGITDVVLADLHDEVSIERAMDGVAGVFYMPPKFLPDEAAVGVRVVELAAEAGVERFVLSGVIYPFLSEMGNHWSKNAVQEALVKSGMNYTILQPTNLMQSIGEFFWRDVLATGEYVEPWAQDKPLSWVDYRDVAEVAARALTEDGLGYGVFELSAAGTFTREDVVAMMSEALDRPIATRTVPIEEWDGGNITLDPVLRDAFVKCEQFYSRYGFPGGNDLILRTILGRAPRTMPAYIGELASQPAARLI